MTSKAFEAGKTAPRLFQDFLLFDPRAATPNVLLDIPPPQGEGVQPTPNRNSCKHEYTTKTTQSVPPPLDLRPDGTTKYKLAVMCKRCRLHADIMIDYSHSRMPCPASGHPLHHFQRLLDRNVQEIGRVGYVWRCSMHECRATLSTTFRPSRIAEEDVALLTTQELLRKRFEALSELDDNREGLKEAKRIDPLSRLHRYVGDAVEAKGRPIPGHNKRFQEAFGVQGGDCHELLERFRFKYADEAWHPPQLETIQDRLEGDGCSLRECLEDAEKELLALMRIMSEETGLMNPTASVSMSSADSDIERTMGALSYQRHTSDRRAFTSNTELPYFNSLGILPDFSDSLVEYAFDRQIACDPQLYAYYLECLQIISEQRNSEPLQIKLATLQSQDGVSRRDLSAAYRYIGISLAEAKNLTDGQIRDKFQAQQSDLGPTAQAEARQHLYKIGVHRKATILINASQQSVDTYEDALSWLGNGAEKNSSDDQLIALYVVKKADSKDNEEIGLKALATISQARKSSMINDYLLTGEQRTSSMTVDEALRHLNIEQRLDEIEATVLPLVFDNARQDRPGDQTERAIDAIQRALRGEGGGMNGHSTETWPVGLTSHGNTCYLNSLLQYYFSIKPLRDIVLNYHQYQWDTAKQGEKTMRVGHAMVSTVEIEGGQRFAEELKQLFERMIKSRSNSVKPDADLVCRAFLRPKDYKLLDPVMHDEEKSNTDGVNSNEHAVDERMTDGDTMLSPTATLTNPKESDSSSDTLVNGVSTDVAMNDGGLPPTPPDSPAMLGTEKPVPETAPPPLPPRRFSTTTKEQALERAQANAKAQQDVTEVHDSITSLLRNGMSPTGKDFEDEQEDVLRSIFSVQTAQTAVKDGSEGKVTTQFDSAIQLNVPYEDTDIYSALDAVFDLEPFADDPATEAYRSMKSLAPLLQISIPRIGYDKATGGGAFKTKACVRLEDELFLDRYFDTSHPNTLARRRQCWQWRKQLHGLQTQLKTLKASPVDLDGPNTVAQTADYLIGLDDVNNDLKSVGIELIEADGDITDALIVEAKSQATRVTQLESDITDLQKQLDGQFKDLQNIKYRLAAVFFHRGSSGYGHYWIYIRDFANDTWRKYNDETVEQHSNLKSIYEATGWEQGTPTYAVYVAEDKVKDYIDPVCRDPEAAPEPPPMDWSVEEIDRAPPYNGGVHGVPIAPKMQTEVGQAKWDDPERHVALPNNGWFVGNSGSVRTIRFAEGPQPATDGAASAMTDEELAQLLQQDLFERSPSPPKRAAEWHADGVPKRRKPYLHTKRTAGGWRSAKERVDSQVNVTVTEVAPASDLAELQLDGVDEDADAEELYPDGLPLRLC